MTTFAQVPAPGYPFGLAVHDGRVLVSTSAGFLTHPGDGEEQVFMFDETGALVGGLPVPTMVGDTMGLFDLAVDSSPDGNRLYIVDMNGVILRAAIGTEFGAAETYAATPLPYSAFRYLGSMILGISFVSDGTLYVADDHGRIWKVPPGGAPSIWFESPELLGAMGLFTGPNGLRIGPDGMLYVAITMSARPDSPGAGLVFRLPLVEAPTGADLEEFARVPVDPGRGPPGLTSIAFAASGRLYASAFTWDQVLVFGPDGELERRITSDAFHNPFGLAFDRDTLLVASSDGLSPTANPENWRVLRVCVGEPGLPLVVPTTIP